MGVIKSDVKEVYNFSQKEYAILRPFLTGFNVNYAISLNKLNSNLKAFILEAEDFIREGYGFEKEIMLVYSEYTNFEDRTIRAAESLFGTPPFKNRIDTLCYILVSSDDGIKNWFENFYGDVDNSKIIFPFSEKELIDNTNNPWIVRDRFRRYSFGLDLFGYTLPLQSDNSFFGRQQILGRYVDAVKRCQNRGIFGLRKTGKTSLLFKIKRIIAEQKLGHVFFYDCKNPMVRKQRWFELLNNINLSIANRLGITNFTPKDDTLESIGSFSYLLKIAKQRNTKIILIFDEIEYISYFAKQDPHWRKDYFEFWQTLWSEQSTYANFCFIISGVNSYVTEKDTIDYVQNPLFGIVQSEYLTGLTYDETNNMIRTLGKRMGLKFQYDAIQELYNQYGGHPMLTRMACSWLNRYKSEDDRPLHIAKDDIVDLQAKIDLDPTFSSYFGHIVSEIKQFYPDEYEMLELLSTGQIVDFIELSEVNEFVNHLYSYGLIKKDERGIPTVTMPVAGRYVAIQLARKEGRKTLYKLIPKGERELWLKQKVAVIKNDIKLLEKNIISKQSNMLFGINSYPDSDALSSIPVAQNEEKFEKFINTFYKCFVESISNYGKEQNNNTYFNQIIQSNYPNLYHTLNKIKVYRNERDHLILNKTNSGKLKVYLEEDNEALEDENDYYFCIQQKIIIELITNIWIEMEKLS